MSPALSDLPVRKVIRTQADLTPAEFLKLLN